MFPKPLSDRDSANRLSRLRDLVDAPLLDHAGTGMVPTELGLSLLEPSAHIRRAAQSMLSKSHAFDPTQATCTFRVAASDTLGLQRHMALQAHFGLMPGMVASSLLVLTTGRHHCQRYLNGHGGHLDVRWPACPVVFPTMTDYQLWHDHCHASADGR